MGIKQRLVQTLTVVSALLSNQALAELSLQAHGFSEVIHRGASLTNGDPAAGAAVSWDWHSGWYIGLDGYYSNGSPSGKKLRRNVNGYLGWFHELDDERALELSLSRSQFPSVSNWNYTEIRLDWHLTRQTALMLAASPDYYGRDAESLLTSLTWQPEIGGHFYARLHAGAGYLWGSIDSDLLWGEAGIGFAAGRFDISATYATTDKDSTDIFLKDRQTLSLRISYLIH